jgi:hypothetical protein
MKDLYELFLTSCLSPRLFCSAQKINIRTFKYWQRKFELPSSSNFVSILTNSNKAFDATFSDIVLEYPNGVKLKTIAKLEVIQQLIGLIYGFR